MKENECPAARVAWPYAPNPWEFGFILPSGLTTAKPLLRIRIDTHTKPAKACNDNLENYIIQKQRAKESHEYRTNRWQTNGTAAYFIGIDCVLDDCRLQHGAGHPSIECRAW
jgi:hypothetical protein